MLDKLFAEILDMSLRGSVVILAVLLVRLLLKKAPKVFSYALWAVVIFRLLCPWSIEAPVQVIPAYTPVTQTYTLADEPITMIDAGVAAYQAVGDAMNGGLGVQHIYTGTQDDEGNRQTVTASWWEVWILFGQYVYLAGVAALGLYSVIAYLRLRRRLLGAMLLQENIYLADHIESPFVLGIFRPKIYLPSGMSPQERGYIIAHEQYHIRRLDHITKLLAFTALTVHWFNPLAWVAYILFCKDMEMSCDEAVVKKLGGEIRADYCASLLNLATGKRIIGITPLAFGEGDTKGRIRNLAKWKKPALWLSVSAAVLLVITSVMLLISPQTKTDDKLAVFMDCQIAQHFQTDKTAGRASCMDWQVLDIKRSGKKTTVYAWVLYQEYTMEDGQLKLETGAHIPTVITAEKNEGQYALAEYWEPRDGAFYAMDIKEKFPWYLHSKALDSQRYIQKQQKACREMGREYFAGQNDPQPGGTSVENAFDVRLTYTGYLHDSDMYAACLNRDKLTISSVQHLPIYKMDTRQELDTFMGARGKFMFSNATYGDVPAFSEVSKEYDNAFFEENTLILVYIPSPSGSYGYELESIYRDETAFCVHVKRTGDGAVHMDDMVGWILCISAPDTMVSGIESFDADVNNAMETGALSGESSLTGYIRKTYLSNLSQKVKDAVAAEWRAYDMLSEEQRLYSSRLFGQVTLRADTWEQMEKDLGLSIKNPVKDIAWLTPTDVYGGIATSDEILHTEMNIYATDKEARTVEEISVSAGYRGDGQRVVLSVKLFSKHTIILGNSDEEAQKEQTGSGIPVIVKRDKGDKYTAVEGYWMDGNIWYTLRVIGEPGQDTQVSETLQKLLKEV